MLSKTLLQTRSHLVEAFRPGRIALAAVAITTLAGGASAEPPSASKPQPTSWKWVASWTNAVQGVLTSQPGSPSPDLAFAIPNYSVGAQEQTFRLIIKPDLWENEARLRLSNLYGTQAVTFGAVTVAWQSSPGNIIPGSFSTVRFGGQPSVTIPAGQE